MQNTSLNKIMHSKYLMAGLILLPTYHLRCRIGMYLRPKTPPPSHHGGAARYRTKEKKNMMSCSDLSAASMQNMCLYQAVTMVVSDFFMGVPGGAARRRKYNFRFFERPQLRRRSSSYTHEKLPNTFAAA